MENSDLIYNIQPVFNDLTLLPDARRPHPDAFGCDVEIVMNSPGLSPQWNQILSYAKLSSAVRVLWRPWIRTYEEQLLDAQQEIFFAGLPIRQHFGLRWQPPFGTSSNSLESSLTEYFRFRASLD